MAENSSIDFNAQAEPDSKSCGCAPPPMVDHAPFLSDLMECGMSEAQASEFMATLVPLVWHFVDLGFRVDISELLLSWADSDALDLDGSPNMETPSKAESEVAVQ